MSNFIFIEDDHIINVYKFWSVSITVNVISLWPLRTGADIKRLEFDTHDKAKEVFVKILKGLGMIN